MHIYTYIAHLSATTFELILPISPYSPSCRDPHTYACETVRFVRTYLISDVGRLPLWQTINKHQTAAEPWGVILDAESRHVDERAMTKSNKKPRY